MGNNLNLNALMLNALKWTCVNIVFEQLYLHCGTFDRFCFLFRCHDESFSKPKVQAIAKPYLVCETPHLAEDQTICPKEEQTEVDPGEVLDIEINAPSGDEFQVSYPFISLDSIGLSFFFFFSFPSLSSFGALELSPLREGGSDREVKLDLLSLSTSLFVCALTKLVLTACLVEGNAPLLSPWQN